MHQPDSLKNGQVELPQQKHFGKKLIFTSERKLSDTWYKKKKRGSKSLTLTEVERALLLTSAKTLTESMIVEMQEKYAAL